MGPFTAADVPFTDEPWDVKSRNTVEIKSKNGIGKGVDPIALL